MKEFKGTPGPWYVDNFGDVSDKPALEDEGFCIAAVKGVIDAERDVHNARLISASPDLLSALKHLAEVYDDPASKQWTTTIKKAAIAEAMAAIDKALGE